ncbi:MAG: glycoside hydrolase family 3 N-terminal domain-containing protein [Pseudomonadota bacterium]
MLYKDASQAIPLRVQDLLGRMTLDEKIGQMHAFWLLLSEDGQHKVLGDEFLGISSQDKLQQQLRQGLGQITRPHGTASVSTIDGVRAFNRLQKLMLEETRLGIPVMSHEECLVGLMCRDGTLFPSALAYGSSWNPELIEQVGAAIGREARSIGCHHGLAPVLDVSRDVRWGRTEETFAEDPYLVGVLGTRYVRGMQGQKRDLLATLKHYVGHSAGEGARNHAPVHRGWRDLNDTFLLPFEMAVKLADAGSVMPAYHDLDGEPAHSSHHLLTEVLRNQWGFDGLIVADYGGVGLLYQHHGMAVDQAEAAALSFNAGLDIELPGDDCAIHLQAAVERGLISMAKIDEIVSRILTEKFRIGLFEKPYVDEAGIALQQPDTIATAREAARQSVIVLENQGILPLNPGLTRNIAVIGPTAADPLAMLGGYSFPVHLIMRDQTEGTGHIVTPLAALRSIFGADKVTYAQGCSLLDKRMYGAPVYPGDVVDTGALERTSLISQSLDQIPAAVEAARKAAVAIVCVGDLAGLFQTGTVGEGSDVDTLDLPGVQQQLLDAVVATGTPTIVVVCCGRPYNLGGLETKVAAYLMAPAGGQQGGTAIAEVLTGAVEPSARLTLSIPKSAGATPYYYNHKLKSAGTPIALHFGSRYPFGYGLSYTQFQYSNFTLAQDKIDIENGNAVLSFDLRNSGAREGVEIPQLYVRDRIASVVRPVKELKAFGRIALKSGASTRVTFTLPVDMLNFTGMAGHRIVEPGVFELQLGTSSANIVHRVNLMVEGEVRQLGKVWRMESNCVTDLL